MLPQILAGLGTVGVLAAIVNRKNNRAPVPADIKAQLEALLNTNDAAQWQTYIAAVDTPALRKWLPQVRLVRSAQLQIYQPQYGEDVRALYVAALTGAVPATMRQVGQSLKSKHPELATNLNDVAKIFGG
jgi:hypothetical protein